MPGSFLERFFAATGPMAPAERGAYLESPPQDAPDIEEAHQVSQGVMGQLSASYNMLIGVCNCTVTVIIFSGHHAGATGCQTS